MPLRRSFAIWCLAGLDPGAARHPGGIVGLAAERATGIGPGAATAWDVEGQVGIRPQGKAPVRGRELSLFFLCENHVPVILISFRNRFLTLAPAIAGG